MGGLPDGAGLVGLVEEVDVGGLAGAAGGGGGGWIDCGPPSAGPGAAVEVPGGVATGTLPEMPVAEPPAPGLVADVPSAAGCP